MLLGALNEADAAFQVADGFLLSRGSIVVGQPDASRLTVNDPAWRQTQWLFTPPAAEVEKARRILAALKEAAAQGKGAASLDGRMIDAASARMAGNVVKAAEDIAAK